MKAKFSIPEIVGWYGMIAIIIAYLLVSFDVIAAGGVPYQLLNFTGALGIIAISVHRNVRQSVVLNIFWAAIALVALLTILLG